MAKFLTLLPFLLLSTWYTLLAAKPILSTSQDIGRHLANGKFLFRDPAVLSTNFYSLGFAQEPFVNHHWGSGLLFHWLHQAFGFTGLSITYLLLSLCAIYFVYAEARRGAGAWPACAATFLCVPLIAYRSEVRPEAFSLLFCGVFFSVLSRWREEGKFRRLFFLPVFMALWVNLHVYFVFGFAILGVFLLPSLRTALRTGQITPEFRRITLVALLCFGATFLNPLGFDLVLTPLQMFRNYGYRIVENQSLLFLWNWGFRWPIFYVFFLATAGWICAIFASHRGWRPQPQWASIALAGIFFLLACLAVRNFALFGFFAIPCLAPLLRIAYSGAQKSFLRKGLLATTGASLLFGAAAFAYQSLSFNPPGIGLAPNVDRSAQFFRENGLRGPIFNNYDIGSYLIYHLFPAEKVFVDNRPEAYPEDFFTHTYIPMQESAVHWQEQARRFGFNSIYFFRHDLTPWAQNFLIRIISDPEWVPVYVDDYVLVLVKNNEVNQEIIRRFELPRSMFGVGK